MGSGMNYLIDFFNKDAIKGIAGKYCSENKHIRFGQAVFNLCYDLFPAQVNTIRATENDCFYSNAKVDAFLDELSKLV